MSIRRVSAVSKGVVAAILAVGLTVTAAGCGSDGDSDGGSPKNGASSSSSKGDGKGDDGASGEDSNDEAAGTPVAQLKGQSGMVLTVGDVERDSGGFVTLTGQIQNTGSAPFTDTATWGGTESGMGGNSLAGATLVDKSGKKRYYVLRDTEKRCLCTSGIAVVEAGKAVDIYIQFPAPPEKTKEVEFQLPTFTPTTLPLSE
ncbi:hypothetical protein SRB5_49750 [Streptomyces sp. RB5]|uniref:Secreted protein n=1 Tax=Streptomyces smaragdinus TaxID=2585196 RepID=A0A7K0CMZ0_9ACTN|nr:hypothetical protein [Streptomyces smaragdinus]MQY14799.1 hypothetical protein [Streptomyces smaragdinus]